MRRQLLASALVFAAVPAFAVDGLLDPGFGIFSTGRNLVAINQGGTNQDQLADVLVAGDGSVFLIGTAEGSAGKSQYAISKLTADGILDLSFGTDGTVLSTVDSVIATSASLDNDGNILVAGSRKISGTDRDFSVCRYNQMGAGVNFSALTSNCVLVSFDVNGGNATDVANDVLVEPNGNIVLVGTAGFSTTRDFAAAARLLPGGQMDHAFSSLGKRTYEPTPGKINHFNAIARRPDGKYIVVGETGDPTATDGTDSLFARLTTSGNLDPTFQGGDGFARYGIDIGDPFNRDESAKAITILSDGNMLMAGNAQIGASSIQSITFVTRIKPLDIANVDPAFGTSGTVKLGAGYSYDLGDMLVQSDGKIVVVGTSRATSANARDMHIVRLLEDGNLDSGFGSVGRTTLDFVLPGELDFGIAGALQHGRIIVAGHSLNNAPLDYDLTVARLANDLIFADDFD